jgi:hypothetical protein
MFDWLKRSAGEGKIRMIVAFTDGASATANASYIGDISTFDSHEFKAEMSQRIFIETGKTVSSILILGNS